MLKEKITMFQAGIIFTVSLVLFLLLSFLNPFENFYLAGAFGEIVPILLPALVGLIIMRKSLKINLKLNGLNPLDGLLIIFTIVFSLPLTMALNAFNMWLVRIIFGFNLDIDIPIPETGGELLISLLVIGVVAAVCEEVLFRGVLQSSFEKLGKVGMFLLVSILFTAFHFSIEQFMGLFLLSVLISYMVYRTNSIFAGMLAHFVNNAAAMIISFFANKIPETMLLESEAASFEFPLWVQIIILAAVVIGFTGVAVTLLVVFHKRTKKKRTGLPAEPELRAGDILTFIPGALIMGAMFVIVILGYIMTPLIGGF
jgi:membrane protease YdiL (CAAX protease family)